MKEITAIQFSKEQLQDGIVCLRGDFDANGSFDYVFFNLKHLDPPKYSRIGGRMKVKVFLMEKDNILKVVTPRHRFQSQAYIYKPGRNTNPGAYPTCPVLKRDGLVQWGEGKLTLVFSYDEKKGNFVGAGSCPSKSW